ncbi:DUF3098 domain-containing protein [Mucilaginibacter agri]
MAQKYTGAAKTAGTSTKSAENMQPVHFIFEKSNYMLLAASVVIVALGFVLMSGTTDIYSSTKIVVAPLVVLAGFGLGFYAILKKPTTKA